MTVQDDYKEALRAFLAGSATPVMIDRGYSSSIWDSYSIYGWRDITVKDHTDECGLVIPKGVEVREVFFSQFQDSFSDNAEAIGINAWGGDKDSDTTIRCNCGKYTGLMIRWEGSFYEAMQGVLAAGDGATVL